MCPDIKCAQAGALKDENDIKMKNLEGFNLIDFYIWPHYVKEDDPFLKDFKRKNKETTLFVLNDRQAIFVDDDKVVLV